jgi:hypothetical protein
VTAASNDNHHFDRLRADRDLLRANLTYFGFLFSSEQLRALQSDVEVQKLAIAALAGSCAAMARELSGLRDKAGQALDNQRGRITELKQRIHLGVSLHRQLKDDFRNAERTTSLGQPSADQLREQLAAANARFERAEHDLQVLEDQQAAEFAEINWAIRVEGFARQINENEITTLLVRFGPLESVQVIQEGPNFAARAVFEHQKSAQKAVFELNGRRYDRATLNVHLEFPEEMTDLLDGLQEGGLGVSKWPTAG